MYQFPSKVPLRNIRKTHYVALCVKSKALSQDWYRIVKGSDFQRRALPSDSNTPSSFFFWYQILGFCQSLATYSDWEREKGWYCRFSEFNASYITKSCLVQWTFKFSSEQTSTLKQNRHAFSLFLFALFYLDLQNLRSARYRYYNQ